ncbi:MAG TPA: DUF885 family protein [Planctomycetota bacterium]
MRPSRTLLLISLALAAAAPALAQSPARHGEAADSAGSALHGTTVAELVVQYQADRGSLRRLWTAPMSAARHDRTERLNRDWLARLERVGFDSLGRDGKVDWMAFHNLLEHELASAGHERERDASVEHLLPFAPLLVDLLEARARRELPVARSSAETLDAAALAVRDARKRLAEAKEPITGNRAAERCQDLQRQLSEWYRFGGEYDPLFTWWCAAPWAELEKELRDYSGFLRREVAGLDPDDPDQIVGDPIGRAALLDELAFERIPYSPERLLEIAEREFEWCRARRAEAARELGHGDDWRAAYEQVKGMHAEPGGQPAMIQMLAEEAIAFLEARDLVSIPGLAKESWRMEMMSPERQKFTPYFTGGEVISISYPTEGMAHSDKLMSMRGNNLPFARATVHHELIPGHHLQGYMADRWRTYRRPFGTPFYLEGWALYWEFRFWDLGLHHDAADRLGMLFWRSHRAARILFSLNFHLENWTAQECVDFLVENVGHERRNAEAEVRRSVQGGYGPLYQCAYMIGGLQIRALHRELVENGTWKERDFHDAVLQQNSLPIEFVRAALTGKGLKAGAPPSWTWDG